VLAGRLDFGGTAMLKRRIAAMPRRQRGLSIVELMVGVAIGLFVVAAATMLVTTQLSDNRRLMLETQVQQDLRASADIITRELRRAGHWGEARHSVWYSGTPAVRTNPYAWIKPTAAADSNFVDGQAETSVVLAYSRTSDEAVEDNAIAAAERFGFRRAVVGGKGVIQTQLGEDNWQALTDGNTLDVTEFTLTMNRQPIRLACPKACPPPPAADCRPILEVRDLTVFIKGRAAHDANVERSIRSNVRLRNDTFTAGTCPG
jgi:Prokaryotic N-terminal methylation motif